MSLYDLCQRADVLIKKYDKYDTNMGAEKRVGKSDDPFQDEYEDLELAIEKLVQEAAEIAEEKNRAVVAAKNAEIRKAKNELLTQGIEALQKKVKKGKGVNKEIVEARNEKVRELIEKIYAIPDGVGGIKRPYKPGGLPTTGKGAEIQLSTLGPSRQQQSPYYYRQTEETKGFEQEWELAKRKQDAQLDRIEKGVVTLGEMAKGMQEEIDKQAPVIDDIDQQMDKALSNLKNNNKRLKGLVHGMRSSRNFCVDIILVCVLLGIGAYIYTMVR